MGGIFIISNNFDSCSSTFSKSTFVKTPKGALEYKRWINFKRFLHDFSQLSRVPPNAIVLWKKYLVYAVVLGEGKSVEKAMKSVFGDRSNFNSTVFSMGGSGSFSAISFANMSNGFSSAFSSAVSSSGSSGFSGGGWAVVEVAVELGKWQKVKVNIAKIFA